LPLSGIGVVFGGHLHRWPELLELTRAAEALGAEVVVIDGDTSFRPSRPDAPVLHSWSATIALLAHTTRVSVASMRIVSHWNAVQLAEAVSAAAAIAPGRLRLFLSIGGQAADRRAGLLPELDPLARTRWLDEMLEALPALWAGECVERRGRFVELEKVRLVPLRAPPAIEVGGRGPALLDLIARRANRWDINLPPVPRLVDAADQILARCCEKVGRDPVEIGRSMWITVRVDGRMDEALRREYRAINPWFPMLRDDELDQVVVTGSPARCRERIEEITETLRLDLPLLDLSGLARDASLRCLERLS
jgi:alkanesulfonate monooxygenase SsuD/methylene tetrahydromethanopterin reductase-like flavin-dependent oxidoreductase (luciferase family)